MFPSQLSRHASILTVLAAAVIYLLAAGFYVERGEPSADEGFYAYASYAVMHGKIPYRDFGYTQMPVLPYLQGAIMSVTGFGVRQQRWLNVCLGALSVALGVAMWRKFKLHPLACWALILAWCFCKPLLYYDTIGKTYAMSQLLVVAAGGCLCLGGPPRTKLVLLSLFGVLAVGCRLTAAPSVFVLWCGLVALHRRQLSWPLLLGMPALLTLMILGPIFAADPSNFLFWNSTYHFKSTLPTRRAAVLWQSLGMAPGVTLLALAGAGIAAWKRETRRTQGACIFLAGIAGWLFSVGSAGFYVEYAIPSFPLVIVGGGLLLGGIRLPAAARAAGGFIVLTATAAGLVQGAGFIKKGYLEAVDHTAAYIEKNTKPTDIILTSMPEIALASHRPVFPGLEIGKFSFTDEMDEETARRRNVVTFNRLVSVVDRQSVPIVVLSNFDSWNFSESIPSLKILPADVYSRFYNLLLRRYDCVGANEYFFVFKIHSPENKAIYLAPIADDHRHS